MFIVHKAPAPKIEIYNHTSRLVPEIVLSAHLDTTSRGGNSISSTQLLSYSFTESVQDISGSFSFSIAGGDDLFDAIKPLQIVKIYEGKEEYPVFTGIIKRKNISCSMTDSGVKRSISIQGKSITSLIAEFQLILDIKFLQQLDVQDAQSRNKDLKIKLNRLQSTNLLSIKNFLSITWQAYLEYTGIAAKTQSGKKAASNILVYDIIVGFLGNNFFELSKSSRIAVPIANSFFNQDVNTVLQIWQCILAQPVYEIFSRTNKTGVTKIVVRESPFDAAAWNALPKHTVHSADLIDYALSLSDEEVYTAFLGYIEGSALSPDKYVILEEAEANKRDGSIIQKSGKKFDVYGLKLCQVGFRGYETGKWTADQSTQAMKKIGERLKAWFGNLDEMYTGSVTLVNHFNRTAPKAGNKLVFLGGEFYITQSSHQWSYGGSPTVNLELTRGGIYKKGQFKDTLKKVSVTRNEWEYDRATIPLQVLKQIEV